MKNSNKSLLLCCLILLLSNISWAQAPNKPTIGASGYPIPRFMSLDDAVTNMRTGPGLEYPIDWIYQKEDYPLLVIAEYANWFKVTDIDGSSGWILRALLSLKRYGIILNNSQKLVKSPKERNIVTVIAEQGVLGSILKCENGWCEMEIGGFNGWIRAENIWGTLDQERPD